MSEWISVKDAPVPSKKLVIISYPAIINEKSDKVNCGVDIFGDGLFKCFTPNGIHNIWVRTEHITHWMPLPELPK